MSYINTSTNEINSKLVFYGPELSGKSTTLRTIYQKIMADLQKGPLNDVPGETDRTLYFNFLPLGTNLLHGRKWRLSVHTLVSPVHYDASRKLLLKDADAVVFVADSQTNRMAENEESFSELHSNLAEHQKSLPNIPFAIQYNKRDLAEIASVAEMSALLNSMGVSESETTATTGVGVFTAFKAVCNRLKTVVSMEF